jgi:hypothetical protein
MGGHSQGSNVRSGYAYIPTKWEALAFVAGWQAAERGEVATFTDKDGHVWPEQEAGRAYAKAMNWKRRESAATWFVSGAFEYMERQRRLRSVPAE